MFSAVVTFRLFTTSIRQIRDLPPALRLQQGCWADDKIIRAFKWLVILEFSLKSQWWRRDCNIFIFSINYLRSNSTCRGRWSLIVAPKSGWVLQVWRSTRLGEFRQSLRPSRQRCGLTKCFGGLFDVLITMPTPMSKLLTSIGICLSQTQYQTLIGGL